jgi:hypothetical protein
MISPQINKLVEAVRALDLEVVERDGKENVRVRSDVSEFPSKLVALQRALEEYDRSSGEADETKATHTFLLRATFALARKVAHLTGDKRASSTIINEALKKYSGEAWAVEPPGEGITNRPREIRGLNSALEAANSFRGRSIEKAQNDIQKRGPEAGPDDEPEAAEPAAPKR